MLRFAAAAAAVGTQAVAAPGVGEALSGIFGSVSLTAWICLLVWQSRAQSGCTVYQWLTVLQLPQLITNYKAKSAEALSMKFLLIWLLGDIANLSGESSRYPHTKHPPSSMGMRP